MLKVQSERTLTLYARSYCHLCDDMASALAPIAGEFGFRVDLVDVDSRPELEARYGERVPVLVLAGAELCHYFLDPGRVRAALAEIR